MKKWSLILLLWYIFVDHTPWIQEPEKKTVWVLRPGWSAELDCWKVKTRLFEKYDGQNKKYLCIDMDYENPPMESLLSFKPLLDYFLNALREQRRVDAVLNALRERRE